MSAVGGSAGQGEVYLPDRGPARKPALTSGGASPQTRGVQEEAGVAPVRASPTVHKTLSDLLMKHVKVWHHHGVARRCAGPVGGHLQANTGT
jgi:hypothetical protein